MKKVYSRVERAPSHPGQILQSGFIEQYDLQVKTVASLLGITREYMSRIINGHTPITPDIASKLEILTKTPASQWLSLQAKYDIHMMARKSEFKQYKKAVDSWIADSLSPNQKHDAKKSDKLLAKACELARHLGRKKNAVA